MDPDVLSFLAVMVSMGTVGLGGYVAIRLVNIFARRLETRGGAAPPELDELRARLEELEADRGRMLELEERVDFAERMLARDDGARKLEAGS